MKSRKLGRRTVVRRPDEVVVARRREWILVRIDGWCRDGWSSLKLMRDRIAAKNVYYLGVREHRLAQTRDAAMLIERHPDIAEWVAQHG